MPERSCESCKHYRPYDLPKLRAEFAQCASPRKPAKVKFAETVRGLIDQCGPEGRYWERARPTFQIVEDEPRSTVRRLDWPDDDPEEDV